MEGREAHGPAPKGTSSRRKSITCRSQRERGEPPSPGLLGSGELVNLPSLRSGAGLRARSVRPCGVGVAVAAEGNGPRQVLASNLVSVPARHALLYCFSRCCFSDVRLKDLMKNVTAFTEELRSAHLSDDTISSILEADISRSQVQCGRFRPRAPGLLACPPPALPHWAGLL